MKRFIVFFPLLYCLITIAQNENTSFTEPPHWSKSAIWYQIFVERFYNGDKSNDPRTEDINISPLDLMAPKGWTVTPWIADWYEQESWAKDSGKDFYYNTQYRRSGGDLQGILDKLDYLQELGINAIFLNPINDAPSLHKYDSRYYHHVDVNFGADPDGDKKLIASENPVDPSTWKWTSADMLFLKLIEEVHKRKMKIIMDYSWNHTGVLFWAWKDILKNQASSPYQDWYDIKSFDDPATTQNEFTYNGWAGISNLPEIKKVNITTQRVNGHPYEGDINPGMKKHIFDVTKRWLAPDGDHSKGVDGFRLDVADQIGLVFWRDYRKFVRSIQPEAYLVGEIWWQQWPNDLMDPVPYTQGDVFDAVMFYQVYRPARNFFAKTNSPITASQFKDSLELQWNRLKPSNLLAMMNVSSSHDTPRLLTCFNNPNKYKFKSTPRDDPNYKTGKPDAETYKRLKLYLVHLFTTIGAPQIWNGEEMGMWGADDPDCRKPLWWKEYNFKPETKTNFQPGTKQFDTVGFDQQQFDFYKKLIAIRKNNPVLNNGKIVFMTSEGEKLAYKRVDDQDEIIVLFNSDSIKQSFSIDEKVNFIDLLNNRTIHGKLIEIEKLSAAILKREPTAKGSSGAIKRFSHFQSTFVDARNIDVWLPEGYTPVKKYAVLYMHDGQMLFDSSNNWNHQEWQVDEIAGKLIKEKKIRDCIVVGIWNNGQFRHAEYFPQKVVATIPEAARKRILEKQISKKPLADNYLKFIVKELKPFIDSSFSTRRDVKNTFIMGSSMGGLISLYALCEYPDVFGGAACISIHSPLAMPENIDENNDKDVAGKFRDYLKTHLPKANTRKIYFDYGDQTLDSYYKPYQTKIDQIMKEKGYNSRFWETKFFPGENHSEKAWAKRLDTPLIFLLKP